MLFSPGQRTLSNDSLTRNVDWSLEGDTTVEQEEIACSESSAVSNNSLSYDELLVNDQETLTADNPSAGVMICQAKDKTDGQCGSSSCEAKSQPDYCVLQARDAASEFAPESEFSDSFTAEEMEMVEEECNIQPSNIAATEFLKTSASPPSSDIAISTQLLKTSTSTSLPAPISAASISRNNLASMNGNKHHVQSVLAMIFSSQSDELASDSIKNGQNLVQNENCDISMSQPRPDKATVKRNQNWSGGMYDAECIGVCEEGKLVQNHAEPLTAPENGSYESLESHRFQNDNQVEDKIPNMKQATTPQSILKDLQTPRLSAKKRVRFSIGNDSSSQSKKGKDSSSAEVTTEEACQYDDDCAGLQTALDSDEAESNKVMLSHRPECFQTSMVNGFIEPSKHHSKEAMPCNSQLQYSLSDSHNEDVFAVLSQDNDGVSCATHLNLPPSEVQDEFLSPNVRNIREASEKNDCTLSGKKILHYTTSVRKDDNCTKHEFIFDDLSPSLSPSFPSQVLSVPGDEQASLLQSGQTRCSPIVEVQPKSNLYGKDEPPQNTEIHVQNLNVHSQLENEFYVSGAINSKRRAANVCIFEDSDDEIMCAAALHAENGSQQNGLLSSHISGHEPDSHPTLPTTSLASASMDSSFNPNITGNPSSGLSDEPGGDEVHSLQTSMSSNIDKTLPLQVSTESSLIPITPFTSSKSRKFLYPTFVKKQADGRQESERDSNPLNTHIKQLGHCSNIYNFDKKLKDTPPSVDFGELKEGNTPLASRAVSNTDDTRSPAAFPLPNPPLKPELNMSRKADSREGCQLEASARLANTRRYDQGFLGMSYISIL